MKTRAAFVFFLFVSAWAPQCFASVSELIIKDTSGVVRNVTQVEGEAAVEFRVADSNNMPADAAQIILRNLDTGEILTAESKQGVVVFDGVGPGTWEVSSASSAIIFDGITVTAASSFLAGGSLATGLGALAGFGALTGATIAIANATEGDPGDDGPLSPSS